MLPAVAGFWHQHDRQQCDRIAISTLCYMANGTFTLSDNFDSALTGDGTSTFSDNFASGPTCDTYTLPEQTQLSIADLDPCRKPACTGAFMHTTQLSVSVSWLLLAGKEGSAVGPAAPDIICISRRSICLLSISKSSRRSRYKELRIAMSCATEGTGLAPD